MYRLSCILIFILLSGCAPLELSDIPKPPTIDAAPELYVPTIESEYRIQVGDSLSLASYFDPQLNQDVTVRPDGRISLLLMGDVFVAGMTPTKLDEMITKAYSKEIDNPEITIVVNESSSSSIYVGGAVVRQAEQPINGNLTIIQAITAAGGFLSTANKQQVLMLRRQSDNQFLTYQINITDILLNKTPNIYLQRTDVLFVPKTSIANAGEFVDQYINAIIPEAIRFNYTYTTVDGENNATGVVVSPN